MKAESEKSEMLKSSFFDGTLLRWVFGQFPSNEPSIRRITDTTETRSDFVRPLVGNRTDPMALDLAPAGGPSREIALCEANTLQFEPLWGANQGRSEIDLVVTLSAEFCP
jgi:hypothetical protein